MPNMTKGDLWIIPNKPLFSSPDRKRHNTKLDSCLVHTWRRWEQHLSANRGVVGETSDLVANEHSNCSLTGSKRHKLEPESCSVSACRLLRCHFATHGDADETINLCVA